MGAHNGQTLALRKKVIPVDKDCNFLAHYDLNANDVLKGVTPVASPSAPLFDGVSGFINCGNDPALNQTFPLGFTIEGWGKQTASTSARDAWLVDKDITGFRIWGKDQMQFLFRGPDATNYGWVTVTGPAVVMNEWHHIAGVVDNVALKAYLYVDGILKTTVTMSKPYIFGYGANKFTIGAHSNQSGTCWPGQAADIRLWNHPRSAQEIKANMNSTLSPNESGLVAYWKLNEGSGIVAADSLGGNDGILMGSSTWSEGRNLYKLGSEGYFGNGLMLEDKTTNLLTISDGRWSMNQKNHAGTVTVTSMSNSEFTTSARFDFTPIIETGVSEWQLGQYSTSGVAWVIDKTYTWSIYVKRLTSDHVTVSLRDGSSQNPQGGYMGTTNVTHPIGEWARLTHTWKATTDIGGSVFYITSSTPNASFEVANPQIENREVATSFVNGSRGIATVQYPISVLNQDEGTISFWAKLPFSLPFTSLSLEYLYLSTSNAYGGANSLNFQAFNGTYNDRVIGTHWASTDSSSNHKPISMSQVPNYNNGGWNMFTITWKNPNGYKVYINGQVIGDPAGAGKPLKPFDSDVLTMKGMYLDELRIDQVQRTDEEIQTWYYCDSPFYPKGIYKQAY
jgi:hypothetical protein